MDYILKRLKELAESNYKNFQGSLIPNIEPGTVLGVRTPALRALAKELKNTPEAKEFMNELPHKYFDENQLHAFLISQMKDVNQCFIEIEKFLPYVDNWATCDQMNPKVIGKYPDELYQKILVWIKSDRTYTVRFAIKNLMDFYLDNNFDISQFDMIIKASNASDEYYIKMVCAWYFATALFKQYDASIKVIEERRLDDWTHRKTIQKARESFRITDEQKDYLKTLK